MFSMCFKDSCLGIHQGEIVRPRANGEAESEREAARKIAEDTGESEGSIRSRINRGKGKVVHDEPVTKSTTLTKLEKLDFQDADSRPIGANLVRDPSCRFYGRCLDRAARANAPGFACAGCRHHEPVPMDPRDAEALYILGLALRIFARRSPPRQDGGADREPTIDQILMAIDGVRDTS